MTCAIEEAYLAIQSVRRLGSVGNWVMIPGDLAVSKFIWLELFLEPAPLAAGAEPVRIGQALEERVIHGGVGEVRGPLLEAPL